MAKGKVLEGFADRLRPRDLKINEELRRSSDTLPPLVKFDPSIKPKPKEQEVKKADTAGEDSRAQVKVEFEGARYEQQEMMVILDLINAQDIEEVVGLEDGFRDKLLKIAKLHSLNERLREINRGLVEEITTLRKKLENQ